MTKIKLELDDVFSGESSGSLLAYIPSQLYEKRISSHPNIGAGFSSSIVKYWKKETQAISEIDQYPYEKKIMDELFRGKNLVYPFRSGTGSGKSSLVKFLAERVKDFYKPHQQDYIKSPVLVCDLQEPKKFSCDNEDITNETFNNYIDAFFKYLALKLEESIEQYLHHNKTSFIADLYAVIYSEDYQGNSDLSYFKTFIVEIRGSHNLPIANLENQYLQFKAKISGKDQISFLLSYLQAINLYRKRLNYQSSSQFVPIILIVDNTDKVHYKILSQLFQFMSTHQSSKFSQDSFLKVVLFARLSTSQDTINSLANVKWRPFEAPDVVRILIERCIRYLIYNEHDFSDQDENIIRSKILMFLLYLTHPKYRLAETIRAVVGTNIRNGMKFSRDYVEGKYLPFAQLDSVKLNTKSRLSSSLDYYTELQFSIYFQRFASIFSTEITKSNSIRKNVDNVFAANKELMEQILEPLGDQLLRWAIRQDNGEKMTARIRVRRQRRRARLLALIKESKRYDFLKNVSFFKVAIISINAADKALKEKLKTKEKKAFIKLLEERVVEQAAKDLVFGNTQKNKIIAWMPVWLVILMNKLINDGDFEKVETQEFHIGLLNKKLIEQLMSADIYQKLEQEKISKPNLYSSHSVSMNFLKSVQRTDSDISPIKLLCLKKGKFHPISCCVLYLLSLSSNSTKGDPYTIGQVISYLRSLGFMDQDIKTCFIHLTRVENRLIFARVDDSHRMKNLLFTPEYENKYVYLTNAGHNVVTTQFASTTYFQFQVMSLGKEIENLHAFDDHLNPNKWRTNNARNLVDAMESLLYYHAELQNDWEKWILSLSSESHKKWSSHRPVHKAYLGPLCLYTSSRRNIESILKDHLKNVQENYSGMKPEFLINIENDVSRLLRKSNAINSKVDFLSKRIMRICNEG